MDFEGLTRVLTRIHRGELRLVARDTPEPSFFAHEILNAKPYSFLDHAAPQAPPGGAPPLSPGARESRPARKISARWTRTRSLASARKPAPILAMRTSCTTHCSWPA